MIIKGICFWIVIFIICGLFVDHIFSRKEAHEQKFIEFDEDIARIKAMYEREAKQKSELLKERQELSERIEHEIKRGESAKLLIADTLSLPPEVESKRLRLTVEKGLKKETSSPSISSETKQIFWDQTPVEQELKVGDWITIDGYPAGLVGAEAVRTNGVVTGFRWSDNKLWGDQSMLVIASQPTGYSGPTDRIVNMVGFIENPSSNEKVARVNKAYIQKWDSSDSALVRVTAQISQISLPDPTNRYPEQWGIDLTSIDVELVKE